MICGFIGRWRPSVSVPRAGDALASFRFGHQRGEQIFSPVFSVHLWSRLDGHRKRMDPAQFDEMRGHFSQKRTNNDMFHLNSIFFFSPLSRISFSEVLENPLKSEKQKWRVSSGREHSHVSHPNSSLFTYDESHFHPVFQPLPRVFFFFKSSRVNHSAFIIVWLFFFLGYFWCSFCHAARCRQSPGSSESRNWASKDDVQ